MSRDSPPDQQPNLPIQLELEERMQRLLERTEPSVYSVSQLVQLASQHVEERFGDVWVEGEVSNLRTPGSGHFYFTLKDSEAQLAGVLFRSTARQLKFRVENGQQLRCRGRLSIYELQGRFQMIVEHAEPAGLGALQLAFEQLKRKLAAEGLFDAEHKQPLPRFPRWIVVVTSRTGAALRDILHVLDSRCPVRVTVCPTAVQGNEAPPQICAALRQADALDADLIIVGRGGGSIEDLWAFNDEALARTIHQLRTPTISAVGHEVDFTIADMVADRRAPTPSAAAELAVPVLSELREQLRVVRQRLGRAALHDLQQRQLRLQRLQARVGTPRSLVDRNRMRLDDLATRLRSTVERRIHTNRQAIDQLRLRLGAQRPEARLTRHRALLRELEGRAVTAINGRLEGVRSALGRRVAALEALSPLAVLSRGYSLVLDRQDRVVRDAASVHVGDALQLRLHRGALRCDVAEIMPGPRVPASGLAGPSGNTDPPDDGI